MKQLFLTAFCLVLISGFLCSSLCHDPRNQVVQTRKKLDSVTLAGNWYLRPVLPSDTAAGKLPVLRFELGTRKFSGSTGCNEMNGSFNLVADQLSFDKNINFSKSDCEGYNEKEFLANLLRVDHYKIKDSTILQLLIGQTPVSEWSRKPYIQKSL
jgi:heat shock protein HslJ